MVQPTHGVSLYNNPKRVEKMGHLIIMSIPSTLEIIQRGADPEHFEILPIDGPRASLRSAASCCVSMM